MLDSRAFLVRVQGLSAVGIAVIIVFLKFISLYWIVEWSTFCLLRHGLFSFAFLLSVAGLSGLFVSYSEFTLYTLLTFYYLSRYHTNASYPSW